MTLEEKIAALEAKVAALEGRLNVVSSPYQPYVPGQPYAPVWPYTVQPWAQSQGTMGAMWADNSNVQAAVSSDLWTGQYDTCENKQAK